MSSGTLLVSVNDAEQYTLEIDSFHIFPSFPTNSNVLQQPVLITNDDKQYKLQIMSVGYVPQYNAIIAYGTTASFLLHTLDGLVSVQPNKILRLRYKGKIGHPTNHEELINDFDYTNLLVKEFVSEINHPSSSNYDYQDELYVCIMEITKELTVDFGIDGDDAVEYEIYGLDNDLYVCNGYYGGHGFTGSPQAVSTVTLTPGKYLVIVRQEEDEGKEGVILYWKLNSDTSWKIFGVDSAPGKLYAWLPTDEQAKTPEFIQNARVVLDNALMKLDGYFTVTHLSNAIQINGITLNAASYNLPSIINEPLQVETRFAFCITDDDNVYGFFVLSKGVTLPNSLIEYPYIIFNSLSLTVTNIQDLSKLTINLNEEPRQWQASFISPTYYPPGTELEIFGIRFVVTTVTKETVNVYHYRAYLKAALEASVLGKLDNTGAYKRIKDTDPYNWERLDDLTTAYQNIIRNRSNNTLATPFEQSFDRFESSIQWSTNPVKQMVEQLYINSQTLVIPKLKEDEIDWISVDDLLAEIPTDLDARFNIEQLTIINHPHKVKFYVKNQYKRAVTAYECPNQFLITPDEEALDNGFYIMACDGDDFPTIRFTYNYHTGLQYTTRLLPSNETPPSDSSGLDEKWYKQVDFSFLKGSMKVDDSLINGFNNMVQTLLKSIVFVANPIITFDSERRGYMDSYFPYPISPWNFTLYLKPTNTGKWIPSHEPYNITDLNLITNLPSIIWTGCYCSVAKISILEAKDPMLNKRIVQQGWMINGFNVGNIVTPFSLLAIESQTRMPVLSESIVQQYLQDISKPPDSLYYHVIMITDFEAQYNQIGVDLTPYEDKLTTCATLTIDYDNNTYDLEKPDGTVTLQHADFTIANNIKVTIFYTTTVDDKGNVISMSLNSEGIYIGDIIIKPPKERSELVHILMFGSDIYVISLRVFSSPPFIVIPYIYKAGEEAINSYSNDYDIITTQGYTNLIQYVRQLITKQIRFEWEGTQSEASNWISKLLPFSVLQFKDSKYVVTNLSISVDGNFVKITGEADNRIEFFSKWNKIVTDIAPNKCKFEVYPRLPNQHYPIPKIYAYSDRIDKLKHYLEELFKYTYCDDTTFDLIEK